jgi:hypothetical protein
MALKREREAIERRAMNPNLPPYKPRTPRGPSDPAPLAPPMHDGQELAGVSTLTGPDGDVKATWNKTRVTGGEPQPLPEGFPDLPVSVSRMTRGDGSQVVEWQTYKPEDRARAEAVLAAWARHAELYAGIAGTCPPPAVDTLDESRINVIPIGDPHIGMLSWLPETGSHFDVKIACRELLACIRELLAALPKCRRIVIGNLGDALHAQDNSARTPGHGNQLDTDGRFAKVLDATFTVFRGVIDSALLTHEIANFRNLPGNHDPLIAAVLALLLKSWYRNEPRVVIEDAFAAHQYDHFGTNLIGWHHGDRSKKGELPAIMANDHDGDGTGLWGETGEHVWHVGHEHHTTVTETPGCFVHIHNTLAAADSWHAAKYRAKRFLRGFTYHWTYGEVSQVRVSLRRVRDAIVEAAAAPKVKVAS